MNKNTLYDGILSVILPENYLKEMKKRDYIAPEMWILTTGTESVLNASGGYEYEDNGIETGGGETNPGDDFWD